MEVVIEPHGDTNYPGGGVAMWIHWKTSGAHLYTYYSSPTDRSKPLQHPLFTLDTYTCKPFSVEGVVRFTKEYFNPIEIVWREIRL